MSLVATGLERKTAEQRVEAVVREVRRSRRADEDQRSVFAPA